MILTGLITSPFFFDWKNSSFIKELKQVLDSIHEKNEGISSDAVGVLCLTEGDILCPKYIFKNIDNTYKEIIIEDHPIQLSDLIPDEDEVNKIKEDGYVVITKFKEDE